VVPGIGAVAGADVAGGGRDATGGAGVGGRVDVMRNGVAVPEEGIEVQDAAAMEARTSVRQRARTQQL
jgi:hypothetical protein